ncbi:hypothetical protein [Corynebacterium sp. H130]|uniref:hypothetical protein n=1 Tax=Corynebacterium sp. H130 TaxID=3133444 RepID=UPI00309BE9DC
MMQWGKRQNGRISLSENGEQVTEFVLDGDSKATALIDGESWEFTLEDTVASATNGEVTWSATADKGFKKAKQFVAQVGDRSIDFINEQKTDWIIDENDVKLGQFTGAANGVRHVEVDYEPDVKLDVKQRVFLAWLARIALEQRLVNSTWILTLVLLILAPFILFVFFL